MQRFDVALLTDRRYTASTASEQDWCLQNILNDDRLVHAALARRGLSSVRVDWSNPNIDWSQFRCALFRSTWDYFERFAEFCGWLNRIENETRLCNPISTVRWNMDKHYLADLERSGIPVVPSRLLERGSSHILEEMITESGWVDVVIKPCVSGAAWHTYRVNSQTATEHQALFETLLADQAMIMQPFQADIVRRGEDSLLVFGGIYSHAVRKVPKSGDFRVQDDHGGTVHQFQPTAKQIALAERAVQSCHPLPAYG
jgi:glutathione synthase/RimK-type ligase-like ATP-grasp enzyme